jgi:hypothetical protein
MASIPRIFWQVLTPQGRYAYAAVIHDYLYWTQTRPRAEADEILNFAMQDSNVNAVTVAVIYTLCVSSDRRRGMRTRGEKGTASVAYRT